MHHKLIGSPLLLVFASVIGNLCCSPTLSRIYVPVQTAGVSPNGTPYTSDQIERAIIAGAQAKGWTVVGQTPGAVLAEIKSGGHFARVNISYNETGWRILHEQSSPGLHYQPDERHGAVIHRRYNHWIQLLEKSIQNMLVAPSFASPTPVAPAAPSKT